jgi:hypothetical protein
MLPSDIRQLIDLSSYDDKQIKLLEEIFHKHDISWTEFLIVKVLLMMIECDVYTRYFVILPYIDKLESQILYDSSDYYQ